MRKITVEIVIIAVLLWFGQTQAEASSLGLLVDSFNTGDVKRFDGTTGAPLPAPGQTGANFTSGDGPLVPFGLAIGADGNLYVGHDLQPHSDIHRYDLNTGKFVDIFTSGAPAPFEPSGIVFGPDKNLYASDFSVNSDILRFDGMTGAFMGVFATTPGMSIASPQGLVFGLDGNLYVSAAFSDDVLRFDGKTGLPLPAPGQTGAIFAPAVGGFSFPVGLAFGPDGNLYVAGRDSDNVARFNGTTGKFIDFFANGGAGDHPGGLIFGPDNNLYVGSIFTDHVLRFDGMTGLPLPAPGQSGAIFATGGGLDNATYLIFAPVESVPEPSSLLLLSVALAGSAVLLLNPHALKYTERNSRKR
jgi:streptogramin lyase